MKKTALLLTLIVFAIAGNYTTSFAQKTERPVFKDTSYLQDYSIKFYQNDVSENLLKAYSDRNGNIQLLSSNGLAKTHDGQFLYQGTIVADKSYRTTSHKKIVNATSYKNQFVYLDDVSVFSNACAGSSSWSGHYGNLRNAKHLYERVEEEGMEFQMGVAAVIRAFNFGVIADKWGDAPYTAALNAPNGEQEDLFPVFDSQETIYKGIIEELKAANTLLSKSAGSYKGIDPNVDLLYGGDPAKWRKMANSLMLRYYMRVSTKLPSYAKAGIEEIASNAGQYPIFTCPKLFIP